jgi:hypothetical protein
MSACTSMCTSKWLADSFNTEEIFIFSEQWSCYKIDGKGRVSVMQSVSGFENLSVSPNPAGKLFMNTDLVGFGRRTGFATKSQDFSPHKLFMNTNCKVVIVGSQNPRISAEFQNYL